MTTEELAQTGGARGFF